MHPNHTPKLCECGCGQPAPIAKKTVKKYGHVKGEPLRFVRGHHARRGNTPEEVFWSYVIPGQKDECWLWTGSVSNRGYGKFTMNGVIYSAHRFSCELHHGRLKDGKFALHKCDTPACVNPDHLFAGTPLDNMLDKMAKGRGSWIQGEAHHKTSLTADKVREIRRLHDQGVSQREIAEQFGIHKNTVSRVVNRVRWAHVT